MKNRRTRLIVVGVASIFAACGQKAAEPPSENATAPALTAATLGRQTVLNASEYRAQPRFSGADVENGASQAQICKACHSLESGGPNMIGPALYGFFGRSAGKQEGFVYSSALLNANFTWTPRALDAWLSQPGRFLPGNSMAFAGVMKQQHRNDLIAYLLNVTSSSTTDE